MLSNSATAAFPPGESGESWLVKVVHAYFLLHKYLGTHTHYFSQSDYNFPLYYPDDDMLCSSSPFHLMSPAVSHFAIPYGNFLQKFR